ncbi:hypothetical protein AVEN_13315-1 [Araneus ventricosus]|uniref:Uncharacterized protein n=1 Tax=Araneus ventricosus TaxID=182803 RepID=A0A4Y2IKS9_ARAVE|nr:hypothetical protein AVEN_13315-1 [Araneus ventricosus]
MFSFHIRSRQIIYLAEGGGGGLFVDSRFCDWRVSSMCETRFRERTALYTFLVYIKSVEGQASSRWCMRKCGEGVAGSGAFLVICPPSKIARSIPKSPL